MSISDKDLALAVIHFLRKSVSSQVIAEDYSESMDVAIDCIADAFEVEKDDDQKTIDAAFGGKSLQSLVQQGLQDSGAKSKATGSTEAAPLASPPLASPAVAAPSAADQENADKLKLEGNRAMANKDFDSAIAKYTEAIALVPSNVVYLSNRAAAYSQAGQHANAVEDAEAAIKLNKNFAKAYSRLGLAKYALGDAKGAMEAYKLGLEVEGATKTDAMVKGYETAKRRVEEELEGSMPLSALDKSEADTGADAGAGTGSGAGGLPDFSSMFGGGAGGGMPNFADMMKNPQLMKAAQDLMSNPGALQGLMNNPMLRNMAQNMGLGGEGGAGTEGGAAGPDLSDLMNNPMLRNMASQFMGGGAGAPPGSGPAPGSGSSSS